jgi:hypothetical protein
LGILSSSILSLRDPANLSFTPLSTLLYFLLYSTLLVLDSSYFSIPHLHIEYYIYSHYSYNQLNLQTNTHSRITNYT